MRRYLKKRILFLLLPSLSVISVAYAQAPQWTWAKGVGSEWIDMADGIATDINGNVYATGWFAGNTGFIAGTDTLTNKRSFFLIKYDSLGNVLWTKNPPVWGGRMNSYAHAVATDKNGNVYITGEYGKNIAFDDTTLNGTGTYVDNVFIAKYDSSGNLLWVRDAPCQNSESNSVTVDNNNNVYIAGSFGASAGMMDNPIGATTIIFGADTLTNPNTGNSEYGFIAKYNASGNVLWAQAITSTGPGTFAGPEVNVTDITIDNTGNVYITGSFAYNVTFGGTIIITSIPGADAFIAKYNASGNVLWAKNALPTGGASYSGGNSIVASGCYVYITGHCWNGIFTTAYDASGNVVWTKIPTVAAGWHTGMGIAADVSGYIYVTGSFSASTVDFGGGVILPNNNIGTDDVFVVKYNNSGTALWARGTGSIDSDIGKNIATDNRGNVYTIGSIGGSTSVSFDAVTVNTPYPAPVSPFNNYVFIAKLHQSAIPMAITTLTLTTTATPDTCGKNAGTATVIASGGTSPYIYSWAPSGGTSASATGLASGFYTVTVIDATGCLMGVDTITVGNVSGSNFTVSTTQTNVKCNGDSTGTASVVPVGGKSPFTYAWTPSGGADSSASGLAAGSYTVVVTDSTGCPNRVTISIDQPDVLALSTKADSSFCGQANGTASVTVTSGGTSPFSYSWNNTNPVQTTNVATGLAAGTYTVIVSDANSCSRQTSVTVLSVVSTLTLTTASSGSGCGTSTNGTLSATITSGGTAPYTYSWNTNPPQTTSSVSNLPAGTYTVLVTDAKGCTVQGVESIAVSPQPKALFTFAQNISCEGISVQFVNTSTQASSYLWNFGDQTTSALPSPTHIFPSTGTFVITLVAEKAPCSDTVFSDIVIGNRGSTAMGTANIFTPNGDGKNDCFTLAPDTAYTIKECLYLEVFDRWGMKFFESDGSDNYCWDGENKKDNKPAMNGTYYYVAKLGETTIKGYVTLIR